MAKTKAQMLAQALTSGSPVRLLAAATPLGAAYGGDIDQAGKDTLRGVGLAARYGLEGLADTVGLATNPISEMAGLTPVPQATRQLISGLPQPDGTLEDAIAAASRGLASAGVFPAAGMASGVNALAAMPLQQAASGAGGGLGAYVGGQTGILGADIAGGLLGGLAAGAASAPFDLVKPVQMPPKINRDITIEDFGWDAPVPSGKNFPSNKPISERDLEKLKFASYGAKKAAEESFRDRTIEAIQKEIWDIPPQRANEAAFMLNKSLQQQGVKGKGFVSSQSRISPSTYLNMRIDKPDGFLKEVEPGQIRYSNHINPKGGGFFTMPNFLMNEPFEDLVANTRIADDLSQYFDQMAGHIKEAQGINWRPVIREQVVSPMQQVTPQDKQRRLMLARALGMLQPVMGDE